MRKNLPLFVSLVAICLLTCTTCLRAELVAHWSLDEPADTIGNESILDSGPAESFNGTPVIPVSPFTFELPGATDTTGTSVQCVNGSINVPFDPALNPDSFTLSFWAKANSTDGYQSVITCRHDAMPDLSGYILYNDANGNWAFWTGRSGGWDGLVGGPVMIDTWTHIAISFDAGTGTKTIYVDGVPTSDLTQQYVPNTEMDLHIGAGGDLGTQYYFDGTIDDVALWNVALGADNIIEVMDDGADVLTDNMVAHWKMDEPEGTVGTGVIIDSGGGDYNGDLAAYVFEPGEPGANENTGSSIAFSGVSLDVLYAPELNPESFTVTAWVKPEETIGFQSVITSRNDIGPGVETQGYILYNDVDGNWAFWTGQGAPGWPGLVGPPVVLDEWQHLAISFDAGTNTKTLYVNGLEVASAIDQGYVPNVLRDLHIGAGGDLGVDFRFAGNIDDVGLWDEALSVDEIQDIMENGISGGEVEITFKRGDVNTDQSINLADAISVLGYLFAGGTEPVCKDSADTNDDGSINLADAIGILSYLFAGAGDLADPFSTCGVDPTPGDDLDCLSFAPCE